MARSSGLHRTQRVFISSTKVDLEVHRALVHESILALGYFPDDMAQFYARPGSAIAESVAAVSHDDVYIGIFAWRYGSILPGETISISHWEYAEAVRVGMPRLIFLADPSTEPYNGPDAQFPDAVRDHENDAQRRQFRAQLEQEQVVVTFLDAQDLARKVAISLARFTGVARKVLELPPRAVGFVGRKQELAQVLTIRSEVEDRSCEGSTLNDLGLLAKSQGKTEEAAKYYEQALAILREVGDRDTEGATLHNLGMLAEQQGDIEAARDYFIASLQVYQSIGAEQDVREEQEQLAQLAELPVAPPPATVIAPHAEMKANEPLPESLARKKRRWPWSR